MRALRLLPLFVCLGALALVPQALAAEPFFPRAGSHAYDVRHYDVHLAYRSGGRVRAAATIGASANRQLDQFSLDFFGPRVTAVEVDGMTARFKRGAVKLRIFPTEPIAAGSRFSTVVSYAGVPPTITDADGSQEGWYPTNDGVLAVGEPRGTAAWIPCNNIPTDKASFQFEVSVPSGLKAVANGRLREVRRGGGLTHYSWVESAPTSTYLAVLDIGRGRLVKTQADGLPSWTLVDPRMQQQSGLVLADCRGSSVSRARPSAPTRSPRPARSLTTHRSSVMRWRARAGRSTPSSPT